MRWYSSITTTRYISIDNNIFIVRLRTSYKINSIIDSIVYKVTILINENIEIRCFSVSWEKDSWYMQYIYRICIKHVILYRINQLQGIRDKLYLINCFSNNIHHLTITLIVWIYLK